MLTLRPYQTDAVNSLYTFWETEQGQNPLIVMPTGSGKSLVIAEFVRRTCTDWPNVRICVCVDSRELVAQNEKELKAQWPEANTGIFSAGLGRKDKHQQILFAGIQSIYTHGFKIGKIDIVIVDEAHMIPRKSQTRYGQFLQAVKLANPKLVVVGLTATPYRLDSGLLCDGDDALFDGISYDTDMQGLINNGWLAPVISKGGIKKIDLSKVKTRMGDYAPGELAQAADDNELVQEAVSEIVKYGQLRASWLIFAAGIDHAKHIWDELETHSIPCALVTGGTPKEERDQIVRSFRGRRLKCLINIGVFTKGFNAPGCDLIALMTATKSTGKYVQMVGRGMRQAPGKENCLLLDYGLNVVTHGPIDCVNPKIPNGNGNGGGQAPCKECPGCMDIVHASVRVCPACGFEFPTNAPHQGDAFGGAVLSQDEIPSWVDVLECSYNRHQKKDKPDSIRADFETYFNDRPHTFSHWITLDHWGPAGLRAAQYVAACGGKAKTVDHALQEQYYWTDPSRIEVMRDGKFWRIVKFDFPEEDK